MPYRRDDVLEALEQRETHSLSWGFVDGSFRLDELLEVVRATAPEADPETLVRELLDGGLIFPVLARDRAERYRTRFGELVRLLFRLRQLFPNRPWLEGQTLVSDFRVDRRPRRYPRRDLEPEAVLQRLREHGRIDALQASAWNALTQGLRLAGFQERAARRILQVDGKAGTIITAGTGSGKTLAFYVPALLRIIPRIDASRWTKAVAIYPRVELLKDQFAEAYRFARLLDDPLAEFGKRPLVLGALFGTTPNRAADVQGSWRRNGEPRGYVCPLMHCPREGCSGDLVWTDADVRVGRERLLCAAPGCGTQIAEGHLALTRATLLAQPPDVLFTTMEMLNRRLSDTHARRIFGVDVPANKRLMMLLLDEVHTYSGTSGAQAALTLRRLRHALGYEVPFAGLSATLVEAADFFGEFAGMPRSAVSEVSPEYGETIAEGTEYQIALRADPSAQVLSTSIQAAMLLARVMDRPSDPISSGRFGQRVFVFTDELDVTNRLFDNLRDAEGMTIFGREDPSKRPLAVLRQGGGMDPDLRDLAGQRWRMCEDLGRTLAARLRVGRTTSQDVGVTPDADVIVATASLEVGYNDSAVGAVMQHKAPRSAASFLQRKGRAGRQREMRPITLLVLSDYGRDRIAFEAFEHLFDPALPAQRLPIRNDYVLRIHAVYATFDWLASRWNAGDRVWLWDVLSAPARGAKFAVQQNVRATLEALVHGDAALLGELRRWLAGALSVSPDEVEAILWQPPRPLLLEALPTLLRRLQRGWQLADGAGIDIQADWRPLPDFVPGSLFGELDLPEVRIDLPAATVRDAERSDHLPIAQALRELAPGRVTRRFAYERGGLSHWVPIPPDVGVYEMGVREYCQAERIGEFGPDRLPVYRPWVIRPQQARAHDVLPSSNATMEWRSELFGQGEPLRVDVPARSTWRAYVSDVAFHLHRFGGSVVVRRFASSASAELRRRDGQHFVRVNFTESGEPAAVGFEFEADGFSLDVRLPELEAFLETALPAALKRSSRSAYVRSRILADDQLPIEVNVFQREWLYQLIVSASVVRANATGETIGVAAAAVAADTSTMHRTIDAVFLGADVTGDAAVEGEDEADDAAEADGTVPEPSIPRHAGRLHQALSQLVERDGIRARLAQLAAEIDAPEPAAWAAWLRATVLETLGEAVLQACIATAPRHAATDALVLDVDVTADGYGRIRITETTVGGSGVIQAFADAFAEQPRTLFSAIEAALAPTDLELAADGLERYLSVVVQDATVSNAAEFVRDALGHTEGDVRRRALHDCLEARGLHVYRALGVSLDARIFRAGTGPAFERTLHALVTAWNALESRLEVAISLREMCHVAATDPALRTLARALLEEAAPALPDSGVDVAQVVGGLLWPRGIEIRQRAMQSYNPFRRPRLTDPALVRFFLLEERVPEIAAADGAWRPALREALGTLGTARLWAGAQNADTFRDVLVEALTLPVEVGYLRFFPSVERIERDDARLVATLSLTECV